MKITSALLRYQRYYVELGLERAGLFEAVRRRYSCETVLYPGSSLHITPSFYFPHVVYVDKGEHAETFWANMDAVLEYIGSAKRYARSAFVRFIAQDFTEPLPLTENSFDLLISLYAGRAAVACKRYLKPGGILLTNNHYDDAGEVARNGDFELVAVVNQRRENYPIVEQNLDSFFVPDKRRTGAAYTRNADYYLFQKRR